MKDRIVEILQYTLKKDSGSDFHQIMDEVSVPLHTVSFTEYSRAEMTEAPVSSTTLEIPST